MGRAASGASALEQRHLTQRSNTASRGWLAAAHETTHKTICCQQQPAETTITIWNRFPVASKIWIWNIQIPMDYCLSINK